MMILLWLYLGAVAYCAVEGMVLNEYVDESNDPWWRTVVDAFIFPFMALIDLLSLLFTGGFKK